MRKKHSDLFRRIFNLRTTTLNTTVTVAIVGPRQIFVLGPRRIFVHFLKPGPLCTVLFILSGFRFLPGYRNLKIKSCNRFLTNIYIYIYVCVCVCIYIYMCVRVISIIMRENFITTLFFDSEGHPCRLFIRPETHPDPRCRSWPFFAAHYPG